MPKIKNTLTLRENIGTFQNTINPYIDGVLGATGFVLGCYTWHWYGFTTLGNIIGVSLGMGLVAGIATFIVNQATIIDSSTEKQLKKEIEEEAKRSLDQIGFLNPEAAKKGKTKLNDDLTNPEAVKNAIKFRVVKTKARAASLLTCSVAIGVCVTSVIAAEGMSLALAAAGGAISGAVGGLLFTSCQSSQTGLGLPYGLSILTGAGLGAAAGVTAYAGTASLCSTASLGVLAPEVAVLSYAVFALPIMYIGSVLASTVATRFGAA